jgi:hypothetical protein
MPARKPFLRGGERPLPSLLRCSIHLQRSRLLAALCTQVLTPSCAQHMCSLRCLLGKDVTGRTDDACTRCSHKCREASVYSTAAHPFCCFCTWHLTVRACRSTLLIIIQLRHSFQWRRPATTQRKANQTCVDQDLAMDLLGVMCKDFTLVWDHMVRNVLVTL